MANELNIRLDPVLDAGRNVTGRVRAAGGIQEGSDVTMSEVGAGYYTGDFSLGAVADGVYGVEFIDDDSGNLLGDGQLSVKGNAEYELHNQNDFNPANDAVANVTLVDTTTTNTDMIAAAPTVGEIRTELSTELARIDQAVSDPVTLANNSITSSVVANNALNNSSFTTGYFNSINAEVDTALADYGANTVAPDNASIAAILVDTDELQTNQGDWITADISALPTTNEDARFTFRGGRLEAVHPLAKIEEITVDTSVVTDFEDNFIELETVTEDAITKTGAITSMTTTAASLTVDSTGADNLWLMGDGTRRTEQDYTHTFAEDGKSEHTVSLVAGTQTELYCQDSNLSKLDTSRNIGLLKIRCMRNDLKSLDFSKNIALTEIYMYDNDTTEIDLSKNALLTDLRCNDNNLPTSEVSQILIDLAANNISNAVIQLHAQTPAAPPAGAAVQALIDLENLGCTVTVDNYLGAQLLTNSDFDTDLSGWTAQASFTPSWSSGKGVFTLNEAVIYKSVLSTVENISPSDLYHSIDVLIDSSLNFKMRVFCDGVLYGDYNTPSGRYIIAGAYSTIQVHFQTLTMGSIGDTITIDHCRIYPIIG